MDGSGQRASAGAWAPGSAGEALAGLRAALGFLAGTDAASLSAAEQAECLRALERADSVRVAARSRVLAAFNDACAYHDDGHGGPRPWLAWQARMTGSAAGAAVGWMRRLAGHPAVAQALAGGAVSVSWARQVCDWTDLLPAYVREDADVILLAAAAAGAGLSDLAGLAEEIRARTAGPDGDGDDGGFAERGLHLDLHYRGAGRLRGDLTPRCAASVRAVLDALGKKTGPEDTRTRPQRDHDALEEAFRRLAAAGCLPDRAGQPTQIQLYMTLDQLLGLPARPDDPAGPFDQDLLGDGSGGGWVGPGPLATPGDRCDASIVPIVTGYVDHDLLDRLARSGAAAVTGAPVSRSGGFIREVLLRQATALLSGPGGLAAWLRTGRLTGPAASVSLPLDIGTATETIPVHLRRSVIARDGRCRFPGCEQPPAACQVHHLAPRSRGGPTRLDNLILACAFHHLIAIHTWGWTLHLNADGTATAVSPDRTRVLNSHDPPAVAA